LGKPSPSQGRNTPDTTTGEGCADGADPRKGQAHHAPHANQWPQVMAGKYCLSGHRRPNQTQPIRARPVKGRSRSIVSHCSGRQQQETEISTPPTILERR